MESINPYILYISSQAQTIALRYSQNQYFHEAILIFIIVSAFIFGRFSHQKKLTHLIDIINDADKTRNLLSSKIKIINESLKWTKNKRKIAILLSLLLVIGNATYFYFTKDLYIELYLISTLCILVIWIIYGMRVKYLEWQKKRLQSKMKTTNLTAEHQLKQIMDILGKDLGQLLKTNFENQIDQTWAKEVNEDCKLYKCYNEKKIYGQLFHLYEDIYNDIKQINLCDICLRQMNVTSHQLGLSQFEHRIKQFRLNFQKMNGSQLQNKKQMVNRLLRQFEDIYSKTSRICRKGCCIRQRTLIEAAKNKYYEKLKRLSSSL